MAERGLKTAALSEVNRSLSELNRHILDIARESVSQGDDWEFFCECGRADCHELVTLGIEAYMALQGQSRAVLAPGHRVSRAEQARRRATGTQVGVS